MTTSLRMTSADLASLPDEDGKRYEIIDGELYVSKQPHLYHQETCGAVEATLRAWSKQTGLGNAYGAPGIIFADDDDVAPDVIWISKELLKKVLGDDGLDYRYICNIPGRSYQFVAAVSKVRYERRLLT